MESDNIIQTEYNKHLVLIKIDFILKLNSITKYQTARKWGQVVLSNKLYLFNAWYPMWKPYWQGPCKWGSWFDKGIDTTACTGSIK